MSDMQWQPMDTAPKDGTYIDIWAKCWRSHFDDFIYARFSNCYWRNGDTFVGAGWSGLDEKWCPTHWIRIEGPEHNA